MLKPVRSTRIPAEVVHRVFAAAVVLALTGPAASQTGVDLPFLSDKATGETNEVVLRLNYSAYSALARISADLAVQRPEAQAERLMIDAINSGRSPDLNAISSSVTARLMIVQNRMLDDERAAHESARKTGALAPDADDPRLKLNQYIVLRTKTIAAAKALVEYAQHTGFAQYAQINRLMGLSATPSDSFFTWTSGGAGQYQWGMHTMNFPNAWDISKGHAYVGVLDVGWPGTTAGGVLTPHPDLANSFRPRMVDIAIGNNPSSANHTVHVTGIIGAQHDNGHGTAGGCPN